MWILKESRSWGPRKVFLEHDLRSSRRHVGWWENRHWNSRYKSCPWCSNDHRSPILFPLFWAWLWTSKCKPRYVGILCCLGSWAKKTSKHKLDPNPRFESRCQSMGFPGANFGKLFKMWSKSFQSDLKGFLCTWVSKLCLVKAWEKPPLWSSTWITDIELEQKAKVVKSSNVWPPSYRVQSRSRTAEIARIFLAYNWVLSRIK